MTLCSLQYNREFSSLTWLPYIVNNERRASVAVNSKINPILVV